MTTALWGRVRAAKTDGPMSPNIYTATSNLSHRYGCNTVGTVGFWFHRSENTICILAKHKYACVHSAQHDLKLLVRTFVVKLGQHECVIHFEIRREAVETRDRQFMAVQSSMQSKMSPICQHIVTMGHDRAERVF